LNKPSAVGAIFKPSENVASMARSLTNKLSRPSNLENEAAPRRVRKKVFTTP
jgi:hypothetical protein